MASTSRTHPPTDEDESFNDRRTRPRPSYYDRLNKVLAAEDYNVGWICALPVERAAAEAMLDRIHEPLVTSSRDGNSYTLGNIGTHNIVITCIPSGTYGTSHAAAAAAKMSHSFPSIGIRLMVGIGGGAPTRETDVRLGDIVVGEQVIQYDMGKTLPNGEFHCTGLPNRPPLALALAIKRLRTRHSRTQSKVPDILFKMVQRFPKMADWARPRVEDMLFESSYAHAISTSDCDDCDITELQVRPPRTSEEPIIHYGKIAFGNRIIEDASARDRLSKELGAICFEMEAAQMIDSFPCLVIRGICDYSDSHKNKAWQSYASAVAAAYTVELLSIIRRNVSLQAASFTRKLLLTHTQIGPEPSAFQTRDPLNLLDFQERQTGYDAIRVARPGTCSWFLRHPYYVDWLDPSKFHEHHGRLWINGKPGAGKSTLMKFCIENWGRNPASDMAVISFFFNANGGPLEKTTEGMYRSLLYQTLQKFPDLRTSFNALGSQRTSPANLTIETLQDIFGRIVQKLGHRRLICYIDALDECDEDDIRSMIEHFDQLGKLASQASKMIHICCSSRHYPYITIQDGQKLILEDQPGHTDDLKRYVKRELAVESKEVIAQILDKSHGVFTWVVVVIGILNKAYEHGNILTVKRRLQELPSDLNQLFKYIILRDRHDMDRFLLCIQWILFSARPLRYEEFYFAVVSGLNPSESLAEWDQDAITFGHISRFLLSSSRGLAEISNSKTNPTVRFIHESLREYLIKENGIRDLWPDRWQEFAASSHHRLKECCYQYMKVDIEPIVPITLDIRLESKYTQAKILIKFPFLEYATSYLFWHAEAAAPAISEYDFVRDFCTKPWLRLSNLFAKYDNRCHSLDTTLMCIFAENNLLGLLRIGFELGLDVGDSLPCAAANGHQTIVQFLLEKDANIEAYTSSGDTALCLAAANGHGAVTKLLIAKGAHIETQNNIGNRALHLASQGGHETVVKLLLEHGADINGRSNAGETCLFSASQRGNEAVVKLLVKYGADVNVRNKAGETCLFSASKAGSEAGVRVLLENGADITAADRDGYTTLKRPFRPAIANLWAVNGADISLPNNLLAREAPLLASSNWHDAIMWPFFGYDGTQTVTASPPTDSGYASAFRGNKFGDPTTDSSFQESANQCIDDTDTTIYSDASDTTFSRRECYISELASHLASETRSLRLSQETQTRVSEALPELLRVFALKIGHEACDKMHRGVMAFVHKGRHEIAAAFADTGFGQENIIEKVITNLGDVYKEERTNDWVNSENSGQPVLEEDRNLPGYLSDLEESDESDEGEDVTESWIQEYREFIFKTPAFKWLLARLRNEIRLVPMKPHTMETIGKEIMSALPPSRVISKKMSSQSYSATFELEWDVFEFFEKQGYSRPPHEVFESVITLTGSSMDAQAATCAQYLGQTWPSTAEDIIALMEEVLKGNQSDPPPRTLSDGTTIRVYVRNSKFLAESYGVAATIAEIGEQLAWLGAALKTTPKQSGLFCCTPTISILQNKLPFSQSQAKPRSTGIACKIEFDMENIPVILDTNGQCWQAVFKCPVIVRGYPIPRRAEWNTGLEIPLNIMAKLAQALELQQFKDKVCLKGFSTMLVPVRRSGDTLFWHLLYKRDGSRISYLDNDLEQEQEVARLDLLENNRHVLGWCSRAKLVIGSSVKSSRLGKLQSGGALTGRTVKRGRTVAMGSDVSIGARESSELFSNGYVKRLQSLKPWPVLLWDKDGKRGWIVSGTIALLLALRAYLDGSYKTSVILKSEDFQDSGGPLTAMSAFETLSNDHNRRLLLHSDGTKLGSKIEELCSLLEHLIDHQIDIAGTCGIKLSNKPRGDLEGWEFIHVADMDQHTLYPRATKIESHGKGWIDFTRAIQAVTLFGCDFGDIIQPDVETCSGWASLPTGRYYVAVCVSDLDRVFKEHGFPSDGHIRLSDNLIWHTPSEPVFCQCQPGSKQSSCEPVQTVSPLSLSLSESLRPRGDKLPNEGALIFGHSSKFSWVWGDLHDPRKGELGEPVSLLSPNDSGIGSSQTPSESECHASSSSRLGIRSMEFSSNVRNKPTPPHVLELAHQTYPKHLYTVGILCALPKELKAVWALFDREHNAPENVQDNRYVFGKMEHHMVVATCLSRYGTNEAASVATTMKDTFNLPFCLLVGIGGGVPSRDNDIRLGDVVVGEEVVQHDLGKWEEGGFEMKEQPLPRPPNILMNAISTQLKANPNPQSGRLMRHLDKISRNSEMSVLYCHKGEDKDVLFQPCFECPLQGPCPQKEQHVRSQRVPRLTLEPKVYYGRIASGNQVIKAAGFRDEQARKLNAICFEMEAAGVVNAIPCLVIRGISDYCDGQKNDVWQEYAAATAAAYAKLLLDVVK
ncbi:unnamed protein product [Clonostachys solani]|uniref:NACHT domain-containing protein n=1 Tax=Clonostachys solani TaxID=160281 RepID=A0A9N9W759_9HYPO|nr:unnamed protein product [Clonostachys solani]